MSFILDGATEHQKGQDYMVHCPQARWPLHYDNGYIMELDGVLLARCKTVPLVPPNSTGESLSEGMPPPGSNGGNSSPIKMEASNNLGSSPSNNPSNAKPNHSPQPMDLDPRPNGQPPPTNVPYIVKIEELWFDATRPVRRLVDINRMEEFRAESVGQQVPGSTSVQGLPKEPEHVYGIPEVAMRTIEFSEGVDALTPIMDLVKHKNTGPISECFSSNIMVITDAIW
jgi:hypothetical protein